MGRLGEEIKYMERQRKGCKLFVIKNVVQLKNRITINMGKTVKEKNVKVL